MKKYTLCLLIILLPFQASACLIAHIYKVFPVGASGDTIIAIDIDIWRNDTGSFEPIASEMQNSSITFDTSGPGEINWQINTYITKYDKHQRPIETVAVDSAYFQKNDYIGELQMLYTRALDKAIAENNDLELFKPVHISFCDLENKHKYVKLEDSSIRYKNKSYPITIVNDSTYQAFRDDTEYREFMTTPPLPPISSVRKYRTEKMELIAVHLQVGQILGKRKKPSVYFNDIESAVYEEPIAYHGHGYDVFFVKKLR